MKRLNADPVYQAKVKMQRAKNAAEKAAQEAAARAAADAAKKKRARLNAPRKKRPEDNVQDASTNKNNFKFFASKAGVKPAKDALDAIHDLMGEWFDFTLDQMEVFVADEGKTSVDTWEDCLKMLKRQGVVKNYWDYSGLCHELLTHDEMAPLLPSGFPPGHDEAKKAAKAKRKREA